ncbi:MAG: hypothetical protein JSC085_000225 [Candidatus Tokpelaia sp. JSC085]|nr:MAG: hypothetical protein JSC085_000225 [Candidatus Tokpelaia sp. JSC085]
MHLYILQLGVFVLMEKMIVQHEDVSKFIFSIITLDNSDFLLRRTKLFSAERV